MCILAKLTGVSTLVLKVQNQNQPYHGLSVLIEKFKNLKTRYFKTRKNHCPNLTLCLKPSFYFIHIIKTDLKAFKEIMVCLLTCQRKKLEEYKGFIAFRLIR